jgi:hypothetical protein
MADIAFVPALHCGVEPEAPEFLAEAEWHKTLDVQEDRLTVHGRAQAPSNSPPIHC